MSLNRRQMWKIFYINMWKYGDIDPSLWMMKYLIDRLELNKDQILWLCFLYAVSYHLPSAYLIWNEYPDLELADEERLSNWWNKIQDKVAFQKDKLKQRKFFPQTVVSYQKMLGKKTQTEFFDEILLEGNPEENFDLLWNKLYKNVYNFGRFSVWNWAQALKDVAGYKIKPSSMFLGLSESKTHTCGWCYALDMDDKVKNYKFTEEEREVIEWEANEMIKELKAEGIPVDEFAHETVSCAFKKIWRTYKSRYVGYYLDRQAEDIISMEKHPEFSGVDWDLLWQARNECLERFVINYKVDEKKYKLKPEQKIILQNNVLEMF